jgi:hypothetical protein
MVARQQNSSGIDRVFMIETGYSRLAAILEMEEQKILGKMML